MISASAPNIATAKWSLKKLTNILKKYEMGISADKRVWMWIKRDEQSESKKEAVVEEKGCKGSQTSTIWAQPSAVHDRKMKQ